MSLLHTIISEISEGNFTVSVGHIEYKCSSTEKHSGSTQQWEVTASLGGYSRRGVAESIGEAAEKATKELMKAVHIAIPRMLSELDSWKIFNDSTFLNNY